MKFLQEIAKTLGADAGSGIQYTVIDGKGGYFQNVKKVTEFSESAVVLCGKKCSVRVEGKGLTLGKYGAGDAALFGEIVKVERL